MAKKLTGAAAAAVPVAAGGLVTVAATLGLRAFLTPEPGTTSEQLYRWAPAIGAGVGLLGAGAMVALAGKSKGMSMGIAAGLAAAIVGGALLGSERLNAAKPGAALALAQQTALPAGTSGLAALLPEYANMNGGMGAIVMDQLNGGMGAAYGDTVRVAGMNGSVRTDAFGDPAF